MDLAHSKQQKKKTESVFLCFLFNKKNANTEKEKKILHLQIYKKNMRAANTLKNRTAVASKAAKSHNNNNEDDNGMMMSINDLMVEDVKSSPPSKDPATARGTNGGLTAVGGGGGGMKPANSTMSTARPPDPKLHLLHGLKSIEVEFEHELGNDWWTKSASTDSDGYGTATTVGASSFAQDPSHGDMFESDYQLIKEGPGMSDSTHTRAYHKSDNSVALSDSSGPPPIDARFDTAAQQQQQSRLDSNHQFAAAGCSMTQEVVKKLEKLTHSALLTYAARVSILLGNFYKLAQEQSQYSNSSGDSFRYNNTRSPSHGASNVVMFSPNAKALANASSFHAGISESNGLIDLYSRPGSSMTTFTDAPLGFSASTASLAHLPMVGESAKLEVSGDIDEGTKTINDYVIVAPIGSGSQGTVELGVTLAGEPRAIKALKRSALMKQNEAQIRREIAIMKKLRHDNVIRLFEVIDDPRSNMIYLVMKYCSNGPLVTVRSDFTCDTLPLPVAKTLLRQLLSGLHYLHLRRIVHRDIKPDNILLDHANVPCFVDFGVSGTVHKKSRTTTNTQQIAEGTPAFWAPEVFQRKRDEQKRMGGTPGKDGVPLFPAPPLDLMAADVYSLGATFFTAVCGKTPFTCESSEKLAEAVISEPLKLPSHLPAAWRDLFQKMMDKDPQRRAKIPSLKLHPVFTEDGQDPGSPNDDMKISNKDMDGAVTRLKGKSGFAASGSKSQNDALGNDDDEDEDEENADPFAPKTPRGKKDHGHSNRALFHRKVVNTNSGKKVSASMGKSSGADGGSPSVPAPPPNMLDARKMNPISLSSSPEYSQQPGTNSAAGGGGLQRSYSTARMPLKNMVRASDASPLSNQSGATKLPPLTTRNRPSSSGI